LNKNPPEFSNLNPVQFLTYEQKTKKLPVLIGFPFSPFFYRTVFLLRLLVTPYNQFASMAVFRQEHRVFNFILPISFSPRRDEFPFFFSPRVCPLLRLLPGHHSTCCLASRGLIDLYKRPFVYLVGPPIIFPFSPPHKTVEGPFFFWFRWVASILPAYDSCSLCLHLCFSPRVTRLHSFTPFHSFCFEHSQAGVFTALPFRGFSTAHPYEFPGRFPK